MTIEQYLYLLEEDNIFYQLNLLADMYEEQGSMLANGLRWCIKNKKKPRNTKNINIAPYGCILKYVWGHYFFDKNKIEDFELLVHFQNRMKSSKPYEGFYFNSYTTAWKEFLRAYAERPEDLS